MLAQLSFRRQQHALAVRHLDRAIELASDDRQMQQLFIARRQKIQQMVSSEMP
jgi:hypothetical protein